MNDDAFENLEDRLLMSDSLVGMVPDIEEQLKNFEDSIVIVGVEYACGNLKDVIAGSLVGIVFDKDDLKIDFRKNTSEVYKFLKFYLENQVSLSCSSVYLQNDQNEIILSGPYKLSSPRLIDLDYKEKTCTLGLDLFRFTP